MSAPQLRKKGEKTYPSETLHDSDGDEYAPAKEEGGHKTYPSETLHDPDGDECAPAKEEGGRRLNPPRPSIIRMAMSAPSQSEGSRGGGGEDLPHRDPA